MASSHGLPQAMTLREVAGGWKPLDCPLPHSALFNRELIRTDIAFNGWWLPWWVAFRVFDLLGGSI